jgi:hypothetical protein
MELIPGLSPRSKGRLAAGFYVLNIGTGAASLALTGQLASIVLLIATLAYVAVTALFYDLFRPVSSALSALAAVFSLLGCAISAVTALRLAVVPISPLGFFGVYCLLIGYLIARSGFVPRSLGLFLAIGGLSWLTFFSPALTADLAPYNMAPGILAEVTLTLWLLLAGVDSDRWHLQKAAASAA